jgi:2-methylisocitrate lyase-like PEP mutase family enzyme
VRALVPAVRALASDSDARVAGAALYALGLMKDTGAVTLATAALRGAPDVAREAAWLLGEVGEPGREALTATAVDSTLDSSRRGAALLALARLKQPSAGFLLPLLADADTGFGNAINARRTVKLLERAGANAIMLEDQTYPKRCGHFDGKDVIPKQEMVSKLKAAVDARNDPDVMILARTDARAVEGFEAALDRARAYQEAGADFLFVEAPLTKEELLAIPREVPGIHLCNMVIGGKTPLLPREELAKAGYAVVLYANAALQASLLAMQQVLRHLHDTGSVAGIESKLMMFADRQKVLDAEKFSELEKRYS